jgi:hypothetical protein
VKSSGTRVEGKPSGTQVEVEIKSSRLNGVQINSELLTRLELHFFRESENMLSQHYRVLLKVSKNVGVGTAVDVRLSNKYDALVSLSPNSSQHLVELSDRGSRPS